MLFGFFLLTILGGAVTVFGALGVLVALTDLSLMGTAVAVLAVGLVILIPSLRALRRRSPAWQEDAAPRPQSTREGGSWPAVHAEAETRAQAIRDRQEAIRANWQAGVPVCPKCGSTSLTAQRRGFGVGRAVVGGVLLGPVVGVLAGAAGSKKIELTCLNCGHRFRPGVKK